MHIYFSGIGGSGISALALLAKQANFEVSGSDMQETPYLPMLRDHGITNIAIDQSYEHIAAVHAAHPIDWYVYSSALAMSQTKPDELRFCEDKGIRVSKRDEFLNMLFEKKDQKLVALAGTHGKSTTTAMVVWLCKSLGLPVSYSLGAKISFGDLSYFDPASEYFVYECDEFDRNFLAFHPHLSGITGLSWDHHEIFPTLENYNDAFREFIGQSKQTIIWQSDADRLDLQNASNNLQTNVTILDATTAAIDELTLPGRFNREDAWLAVELVAAMTGKSPTELIPHINHFPGLTQRMELLAPNLYTNYAHTPEKIKGGMDAALEIARAQKQNVVVVYEPLTNRRQHYIKDDYKDCFAGVAKLYWVPTYLAREDPNLPLLTPAELIPYLSNASIAEPAEVNDALKKAIQNHLDKGDLVVAMDASGKGSLDEWLRQQFTAQK